MFEHEPDLLTRKQAQELLQISKTTILNLIHAGYLSAIEIASSYRIEKEELILFVERSKKSPFTKL